MRKFLIYAIPITSLIIFILIMQSGNILKKPFGDNDNFPQAINDLIEAVGKEYWDVADQKVESLTKAWKKVLNRVQFSSERDEINKINICIARIKGAIMAKDKTNALMELYEAFYHWEDLGS
ncbi:uncharacterized protein DUF4363 [Herbinix hemicellulosilytica]|uniref:Uncharacterized protein n=1 Tax=Herbinix hemicellulosilytica TaxID=1564487 RepID=A0A0H5SF88_HERHM|nr:DUF4363 family protein [Herbinix hemicellulosilytica]RBP57664.1 uncharacterized protein DUF4363 [Herbinix hemicellulosilytica]CRZ34147.1 hypothetical protein HHT355_0944 [Herbinix hemicellulosilytica]